MPKIRCAPPRISATDSRRVRPPEKRADPFYLSAEWRVLVDRVVEQRGRRCEACGRTPSRIFGDHIHELRDGGAKLDPSNIRLLCGSCHTRKTAAVRAHRLAR